MTALKAWIRSLEGTRKAADVVLPGLINSLAETHGHAPALIDETSTISYRDLATTVDRYAYWAIKWAVAAQTVALLMHNSADYVALWLGLTRVGCKVALLNTNLSRDALLHCIHAVEAKYLIGSDDLTDAVADQVKVLCPVLERSSYDSSEWSLPLPQDIALYIYTSGTTGLPKAVKITHRRITEWSYWFAGMEDAQPSDRLYNCLPMYHSIGGVVAVGSMLVAGGSVVIRKRFSASTFWEDVAKSKCTIFQYIGELCRYLVQSPIDECNHTLRLAVGNGLQADIWPTFKDRFGIPQILEYYATTEGVLSLYNYEGKPGAIGRIPTALQLSFVVKLIQIDEDTGEPVRDANGFCIAGDQGEAITLIRPDRQFDGYNDAEASGRKILANVFSEGDRWYRTGDLMRRDREGFFYFVDRLGDTFRWKGENVSTTEVANVIRACPGVTDAIVYGVKIPGTEGRAGMAAITTTGEFSWETLVSHLDSLPSYARPLFVRLSPALDLTGTFKLAKSRFVTEGYTDSNDPVYVWASHRYVEASARPSTERR